MKIIIIGGGRVGFAIASQLTGEGHDITVVDRKSTVADRISDRLDCMALCGSGSSTALLQEAGVEKSDLLIACTGEDELNLLCCMFAKKLGCASAIARVRTPEYAGQMYLLREDLGLSMTINPEQTAASELFRLLEIPGVLRRDSFAKGRVEIVEIVPQPGSIMDGTQLMDLQKKIKCRALVGAVQRGTETIIPDGRFTIQAGDKVYVCAPATEIVRILRAVGEYRRRARNVMLIGGSRVASYLIHMLLKADAKVKLIELDPKKAADLAERFPEASVVCADGSREEVLREEGAAEMDAIAVLTNLDEENLILAMYAAALGVPQVLAKVDHTDFGSLITDPRIRLISPKSLTADAIVRDVRAMQNSGGSSVVTLHHIASGNADALEFNVTDSCAHLGEMLRDVRLKPNTLIGCINRRGKVIIPGGADTLEAGDTVVVITGSNRVILDLNDIFAESI